MKISLPSPPVTVSFPFPPLIVSDACPPLIALAIELPIKFEPDVTLEESRVTTLLP